MSEHRHNGRQEHDKKKVKIVMECSRFPEWMSKYQNSVIKKTTYLIHKYNFEEKTLTPF